VKDNRTSNTRREEEKPPKECLEIQNYFGVSRNRTNISQEDSETLPEEEVGGRSIRSSTLIRVCAFVLCAYR
jgi:hypothetical protein